MLPHQRGTHPLRAPRNDNLRHQLQCLCTANKSTVIKGHELTASGAAHPVKGIGEVQAAPVELDGILHRFPSFYCDIVAMPSR